MFGNRRFSIIFVVVVVIVFVGEFIYPCNGSPFTFEKKVDVRIINGFDNVNLGVHCKSGDDDLGAKVLGVDKFFEFRFRPNFWGTTLYFCNFTWGINESRWFDIYVQERDVGRCNKHCWWLVGPDGPCLYNENSGGLYDLCADWNKN